ncbi:MAG TPA: hypothetical protein VF081_10760 [Solirubrobacterales bacterium]
MFRGTEISRRLVVLLIGVAALLGIAAGSAQAAAFEDSFSEAGKWGGKQWWEGAPGSNNTATHEAGEPAHAGFAGVGSVWMYWIPSQTQTAEIRACGGKTFDSVLGVYTGPAVNELTEVASNDDNTLPLGCAPPGSSLRFPAVAETKYMIAVDSKEATGIFNMRIRTVPVNDDFANAEALGTLPANLDVDNRIATTEAGEPSHAGMTTGHTVWYQWTAPSTEIVTASTCTGEGSNTAIGVYTGTAVNALTEIASNNDAGGLCGKSSEVSWEAIEGTTYRIALDGTPKFQNLYLDVF